MASSRRSARLSGGPSAPQVANGTLATTQTNGTKARKTGSKASQSASTAANTARKRTAPTSNTMPPPPVPPSTPQNKRRRKATDDTGTPITAPPLTPTPSAIGIIALGRPPALPRTPSRTAPRPAEPHATNAPLSTPGGSRVTAFPPNGAAPALTTTLMLPATTTETLLAEAEAHLIKVDPGLRPMIEGAHCKMFSPEGLQEEIDPFRSLVSSIMAQQVSGAAASSIKRKFIALFPSCDNVPGAFPSPSEVAVTDITTLRTAGLSQRKAEYVQGLAEKFASGELSAEMLVRASDEEVMEKLVAVRGLGRWSVEMFACFALKRMDVFSTGDLGVQRGVAAYLGRDVAKLKNKGGKWKYCSEQDMLETAAKFAPYRSLFMWYTWRMADGTDINAIADE